ncbi:ECF transporter S component [Tetragenococcus koreensis]|uniref:Riboflavin transporter n=1 Tax=Tetragenococcus koreensis TaxID=290335 RepID=A0AAN4RJ41_9ENTE|nr:ECF transporter S component [Tetragenococcus koreensis]AYW45954.1 ECF transporter S component [Tetragenococcus koreensis]MCF1621349.1 ECF transporter S component [Tetragenococcus koreensis]MCF1626401.1 ECF transporter S component [Tetragenococcus koreensis]MCF1631082.1 ECF transporter S component [Tetragenococcus koreensis]MCF1677399.1 ECF transporter S component [Tetragenococcus koreensis]
MKKNSAQKVVFVAVLGTIAYLLMLLRFPLPFMPPFMDFDLSGIPEMIGTFLLGPSSGIFIALLKNLLKLATTGSSSMFTGEAMNFLLSVSYLLPAWLFYRKQKTKKDAIIGMIIGTFVATVVACLANIYVILPFYGELYNLPMDEIVAMTESVNPYVNSVSRLVVIGIAPFNLIKNGVTTILIALSLDRLKKIFKRRVKS